MEMNNVAKGYLMAEGFIDIHAHVIPGVDDGAQSDVDSREMLIRYKECGFDTVIATPHSSLNATPEYEQRLVQGARSIAELGARHGIRLLNGREIRLTPEIQANYGRLAACGLAGTRYVLVDFPSGGWPYYAENALFQIQTAGLIPILAHPERYGWGANNRRTPRELVARGVLLQVTLGSLVGAFGSQSRATAAELIESGLVHFTATDAHGPGSRMRAAVSGIEWLRKEFGDHSLEVTLLGNPSALLNGESLQVYTHNRKRKKWSGIDFRRILTRW